MSPSPVLRVVTGHDVAGRSIVTEQGPVPNAFAVPSVPGTVISEVWRTTGSPAVVDNGPDPTIGRNELEPGPRGTVIRIVDIPPDGEHTEETAARLREMFVQLGNADAHTVGAVAEAPHPMMHRTETVDYGVVLEGQMTLVLDADEVVLDPGTVVVQRGTNHAWANRSGRFCRMMFVLIDGTADPARRAGFPQNV